MAVTPRISLLHATFRREEGPLFIKEAWSDAADHPEKVEHIFAMDADDEMTIAETEGHLRVISPAGGGIVTSVRNWNQAARAAHGDLLVVIADDLLPPASWDSTLEGFIHGLDPRNDAFAVKLTDSPAEGDTLLRHPVISRAFYRRHGLFSDRFTGVYCDDDLTTRAFWKSVIIDGRALALTHPHPSLVDSIESSASQLRINAEGEYERGRAAYDDSWSRRQRSCEVALMAPASSSGLRARSLRAFRWQSVSRATLRYSASRLKALVRLARHPRALLRRLSPAKSPD
jgi:hypothetical protein